MIIDTHSHIVDEHITRTPTGVIEHFFRCGGDKIFVISTSMKDCQTVFDACKQFENAYPVIGVHPHYADDMGEKEYAILENLIKDATAVGEIGLDYYYDFSDREKQKQAFIRQLDLAVKYSKPVNIHTREATSDTLEILGHYPNVKGIIHCFGGDLATAQAYIKLGYLLGIGGTVTFKKSAELRQVVKAVGLEHIVLETDSPYLTPEPYRGQENEPYNVTIVAQKVADILETSVENVYSKTTENVINLFNLKS